MNQIVEKALGAFTQGLPAKACDCGCEECREINEFAFGKLPLEYPSEIGSRLCLLAGQSICHFIPGLMKMAFEENEGEDDTVISFLNILSQPISKKSPPRYHPKLGELSYEQTLLVHTFVKELYERWSIDGDVNKSLERSINNWAWFLSQSQERQHA